MRAALLIALALLAGCPTPEAPSSTLVCERDGHETYRATTGQWIYTEGSWWNRYDDQQYRPSAMESCHTEVK